MKGIARQRLVAVEGAKTYQRSSAVFADLRLVSCEWGSASASLRMPDMSVPSPVGLVLLRLRARNRAVPRVRG